MKPPEQEHASLVAVATHELMRAVRMVRIAQETQLMLQEPRLLGRHIPGWFEWPEIEKQAALAARFHQGALDMLGRHRPNGSACESCWRVTSDYTEGISWADCPEIAGLRSVYLERPDQLGANPGGQPEGDQPELATPARFDGRDQEQDQSRDQQEQS